MFNIMDNKSRISKGVKVLLFLIGISLGVYAGIGCFNYATLAKKAGDPENIFWLVGAANIAYWVGILVLAIVKDIKKEEGKE